MQLFEYGIQTEKSDIRAHVSVACKSVFVFKTQNALDAISGNRYPVRPAYQKGCEKPTAEGWLVPWDAIKDIRCVSCPEWRPWSDFSQEMTTSQKGDHAVRLVLGLMEQARFPIWLQNQTETCSSEIQIQGADVVVHMNQWVQVKCDWYSGPKSQGGTGNLYLQKSERNPFKHI